MNTISVVTLNLAGRLHDNLAAPREWRLNGDSDRFVIKGGIPLKGCAAQCSIYIAPNWVTRRPDVICHEPWLKKNANWHTSSDSSLCYVYAPEWRDFMNRIAEKDGMFEAADAARLWLLQNVQWLLNKHVLAEELGIKDWQKDWPFWPHDQNEAERKYRHQR